MIVPILIEGPGEIFPAECNPRWERIVTRQFEVLVTIGEPISGEKLHTPRTLDWLRERDATPVDFVMSRIVMEKPERANPSLRHLYHSLTVDIPTGLLIPAA